MIGVIDERETSKVSTEIIPGDATGGLAKAYLVSPMKDWWRNHNLVITEKKHGA